MYSRDNSYSSEAGVDFSSVLMRAATSDRAEAGQAPAMQMLEDDIVDPGINRIMRDPASTENKNLSSIITHIRDDGAARLRHKKAAHVAKREKQRRVKNVASKQNHRLQPQARSQPVKKTGLHQPVQSYTSIQEDRPVAQTDTQARTPWKPGRWQPFLLSLAIAVTAVMGFNLYQLNDQAIDMKATLDSYQEQIDQLSATQRKSSDALITVSRMKKEQIGLKQQVSELTNDLASTRAEMTNVKVVNEEVKGTVAVETVPGPPLTGVGWVVNLASLSSEQKAQASAAVLEASGIQADVYPVMVNATMLYRLSVKGFASRAEAMQFVNKARLQYGFDGGWVWQS